MLKHLYRLLFCLITIGSVTQVHAQEYERSISISEWIEEMANHKDSTYILQNTEIYYNENVDSLYAWWQPRTPAADTIPKDTIHIRSRVMLFNCKLPENSTVVMSNLIFHRNVSLTACQGGSQMIFYNDIFHEGLDIRKSDMGTLQFQYSSILHRIIIAELQINLFSFSNCKLSTEAKLPSVPFNYGFEVEDQPFQILIYITQNENKINTFNLSNCEILETDVDPVIQFNGGIYDIMYIDGIEFKETIIDFIEVSVKEVLAVQDCIFNKPLGTNQFNFPLNNTSFYWDQLSNAGLGLYYDYAQLPFNSQTDTLSAQIYVFNALKSMYSKFHSMYRTQGDIESANASYVQMKDMETRKYQYGYLQNPDLQSLFNWRLNQFLKYFSAYGTSPVKSLIFSMWTILLFAALYFFFPSDWDQIDRKFLIGQHRKLMEYFKSEQKLEDFYSDEHKELFQTFEHYKKEIRENKGQLPAVVLAMGKPLYLAAMIKHKFLTFFYRRIEILKGRWVDLSSKRKTYVALVTFFSLAAYTVFLIGVRTLNSVTLSINVFSTLGFGAIPVQGITRYITIIEGFIGWFLLSIFSVSLIGQVLQS
ncbi:MAG: hypothetical protein R8G66_26225 [Cytophagales bacterium]|nr:hypothetical protein [Cytophagales bacterium]